MVGKIYVNRKNDGMFNNFEKCIEAIFPTAGGVTGSLLSITAGNVIDTMIYAAFGAVAGIILHEIYGFLKMKINEKRNKRKNRRANA